jgi:energy-coupling factor transport system substrate-specific component
MSLTQERDYMPDMCPDCENAVRPGDKFCSNCARLLSAGNQQTISSTIGNHNIGSFIGNTLQNTNITFHETERGEPIASIDRTHQQPLKLFGHPLKTGWLIFAGALGIFAQLADISSGFFSGQLHTYMPFWVGMGVMMVGFLCLVCGIQLYRFRFASLIGPYGLQSGADNSVHLIKISGICPICSGELTLRSVGPKEQKILMVVCKRNPFRHQWLFDHTVIRNIT